MIRFLAFVFKLALIFGAVLWLADRPGTAHIIWHDYVIETSAAFLALVAFAVGIAFYFLFRLGHLIKYGPERWKLHRKMQKWRRGQDQLTQGMIAIASGNASEAGKLAVGARKLLGPTAATQMLQAQAAQMAGDTGTAREIFRNLAAHPETSILGYRGLIIEAKRERDWAEVEKLTEKLGSLKPNLPWLNLIRFENFARHQEWDEALDAYIKATQARLTDAGSAPTVRAALLVASSQKAARYHQKGRALMLAEQAARNAPDWMPALLNLAECYQRSGQLRAAQKLVERHWTDLPQIELGELYSDSFTDPLAAHKAMEKLCRANPEAPQSHLALAQTALAADLWGEARRHLIALVSRGFGTRKVYRLFAKLERRENGDEQAALHWLTKAEEAASEPVWVCRSCGGGIDGDQSGWVATCPHCHSFNTLQWRSPDHKTQDRLTPLLASHDFE